MSRPALYPSKCKIQRKIVEEKEKKIKKKEKFYLLAKLQKLAHLDDVIDEQLIDNDN